MNLYLTIYQISKINLTIATFINYQHPTCNIKKGCNCAGTLFYKLPFVLRPKLPILVVLYKMGSFRRETKGSSHCILFVELFIICSNSGKIFGNYIIGKTFAFDSGCNPYKKELNRKNNPQFI